MDSNSNEMTSPNEIHRLDSSQHSNFFYSLEHFGRQWVYLPGWVATIRLTLRRTLIRSVILFGIVKQVARARQWRSEGALSSGIGNFIRRIFLLVRPLDHSICDENAGAQSRNTVFILPNSTNIRAANYSSCACSAIRI